MWYVEWPSESNRKESKVNRETKRHVYQSEHMASRNSAKYIDLLSGDPRVILKR